MHDICKCMQESDLSIHMWDALLHLNENLYVYICENEWYLYMYASIRLVNKYVRRFLFALFYLKNNTSDIVDTLIDT